MASHPKPLFQFSGQYGHKSARYPPGTHTQNANLTLCSPTGLLFFQWMVPSLILSVQAEIWAGSISLIFQSFQHPLNWVYLLTTQIYPFFSHPIVITLTWICPITFNSSWLSLFTIPLVQWFSPNVLQEFLKHGNTCLLSQGHWPLFPWNVK